MCLILVGDIFLAFHIGAGCCVCGLRWLCLCWFGFVGCLWFDSVSLCCTGLLGLGALLLDVLVCYAV